MSACPEGRTEATLDPTAMTDAELASHAAVTAHCFRQTCSAKAFRPPPHGTVYLQDPRFPGKNRAFFPNRDEGAVQTIIDALAKAAAFGHQPEAYVTQHAYHRIVLSEPASATLAAALALALPARIEALARTIAPYGVRLRQEGGIWTA